METVEAVYENGVLKPKKKLNIPEGSEVTLIIYSKHSNNENIHEIPG